MRGALLTTYQLTIVTGLIIGYLTGYLLAGTHSWRWMLGLAAAPAILLLPLLIFSFFFNMWHISKGFADAVVDLITSRKTIWQKTERFRKGPVVKEYV